MNEFLDSRTIEYRNKVREFAEREVGPLAVAQDELEEFPAELAQKMGQEGLFGITLPQKYGGQGLDTLSYIIAVEEIARVDSSPAATVAAHNSLGIAPIYVYGTEEQRLKYLPDLCTGLKLWAFGLTEVNAGSDAKAVETRAELTNGCWHINGSKMFITNSSSSIAAGVTLQAVTNQKNGEKELSAILVERSTSGYFSEPIKGKLMWRAADNGKMRFRNCTVPEANLLGKRGEGMKIMLSTLDAGRLSIAAIGLGLAQGAFEMAVSYAKKRKQFGKSLSEFQAISFKLAEMATKIELARNTLYHTCRLKDAGLPYSKQAAIAKLSCSETARDVAEESLQIHGAYGFLRENHIERFYRDQRLLQIGEGTSEILKMVISRHIL
jgi:alkylation response protein AidB-like acyl-CoA dehydrogenase